jgi:hypothetical protein
MTKAEAKVLRGRWKQRAYPIPCDHLTLVTLESERDAEGRVTGRYHCILCGELFVAQVA